MVRFSIPTARVSNDPSLGCGARVSRRLADASGRSRLGWPRTSASTTKVGRAALGERGHPFGHLRRYGRHRLGVGFTVERRGEGGLEGGIEELLGEPER